MSYNSSTGFARPLQVEPGASTRLAAAGAAVHALAVAGCVAAGIPGLWSGLLAGAVLLHFALFLRHQAGGALHAGVRALGWDARRGWRVRRAGDCWRHARLREPVFVSERLVIVRFSLQTGRHCSVMITADRLPADTFRRLRVRLLQSAGTERN